MDVFQGPQAMHSHTIFGVVRQNPLSSRKVTTDQLSRTATKIGRQEPLSYLHSSSMIIRHLGLLLYDIIYIELPLTHTELSYYNTRAVHISSKTSTWRPSSLFPVPHPSSGTHMAPPNNQATRGPSTSRQCNLPAASPLGRTRQQVANIRTMETE